MEFFGDAGLDEGRVKELIPDNNPDLQTILNYVYVVMGTVAVVTILYNAMMYLMSEGDPSRVKRATQGILFAAIGLVIILLATLITNFIFTTIGAAE